MSGQALAERFYHGVVKPMITEFPHAAALLGRGSEVLGYDDDISTDHDFSPRVQIFVASQGQVAPVVARLDGLPAEFDGFPVAVTRDGVFHHQVEVTTPAAYFTTWLGVDAADGMSAADWLLTPTQVLAGLTAGAVFHDPLGALARRRVALTWYPDDVWRYVLASAWLRIEQEEAFVGRAGASGDDLGSRIVAARLVRELVRLAFLVQRRWAPYGKWLGRAFGELRLAEGLHASLTAALGTSQWRQRQAALCDAAAILGTATNDLRLCAPVDATPRRFHSRVFQVSAAVEFTTALAGAITDPEVRAVLSRLGYRRGTNIGLLAGAIDQAVDSTDVLRDPDRRRGVAAALGLTG